jgi:hypothetical protein
MKPFPLALEVVAWFKRNKTGLGAGGYYARSHAERDGGVLRFYHPCGHTSWEPWVPEFKVLLVERRWRWDQGGVHATCPRCYRARRAEAKKTRRPMLKVRNLGRVGPDWVAATS